MIDLSSDDASKSLRVREFYLGRQPILDRNQALFGYELLFRNAPVGPAVIDTPGLNATAAVLAHAAQLGMERTVGDAIGFVNVDADAIMSDIFGFLPREKIVHVAQSLYHDHVPAKRLGLTTVWIDRRHDRPGSGATPLAEARPDATFPDMASFAAAAVPD